MKLAFKDIEPFVKNPNPNARIVLVYGPDQGLMTERSKTISKSTVDDLNDPFNVATFTNEKILSDTAAFYDEANAQSLMGGNRLILIKNGTDSITPILKDYLDSPSKETLIVVEAGNLGPKSSLRKLCESDKKAAAVPCYVDDERNLAQIIRDMCTHAGYRIDQDALIAFSSALVGDRIIAKNEIEKLILYKGHTNGYQGFDGNAIRNNIGQISMNDIMASCGDVRDWSMDTLVYAIGDGDIRQMNSIIASLYKDMVPPIVILRSTQNHFWRLLGVKLKIDSGLSHDEAVKTLSPPLFWKVKDAFNSQLRKWSIPALESAIDTLNKVEGMSKQTGYTDTALVENALTQIGRYNPSRRTG